MALFIDDASVDVRADASLEAITRRIDLLNRDRQAVGDGGEVVDIHELAVTEGAGRILEHAAAATQTRCSIEVGCASGLSTMYICRGRLGRGSLEPGTHLVMDPKQRSHWKNIGRRSLCAAGLLEPTEGSAGLNGPDPSGIQHGSGAPVVLYEEPAHTVLPRLLAEGVRAQFAFIDGWHMLDYVMVEAFYCDLMLDTGGVIALHDLWMPGLQAFAAYWCSNRKYEPVCVHDSRLTTDPTHSTQAGIGDPTEAFPGFVQHLAPFVDHSVLLLRKTGHDQRRWDEYEPFCVHRGDP